MVDIEYNLEWIGNTVDEFENNGEYIHPNLIVKSKLSWIAETYATLYEVNQLLYSKANVNATTLKRAKKLLGQVEGWLENSIQYKVNERKKLPNDEREMIDEIIVKINELIGEFYNELSNQEIELQEIDHENYRYTRNTICNII